MGKRIQNLNDLLPLLSGVKRNGKDGYMALCPGHNDTKPSLSIKLVDGKILLYCFAGCKLEDILEPLRLEPTDLYLDGHQAKGKGGYITGGQACQPVSAHQTPGITLAELSEAKRLPIEFLKSLGLADFKYSGQPAVRIPYADETGEIQSVRFRIGLDGLDRFTWRRGDHVMPYGMNRLQGAKRTGWILLGEGESDGWTAWYYGLPYLGIPGKNTFKEDWAKYLEGLDVYLWQEPNAEDFTLKAARVLPKLKIITAPEGIKDISEARIQGLDVVNLIESLKGKAEPIQDVKARIDNARLDEFRQQAREVIEADEPLELVEKAIRELGYGGDIKPAMITYLAVTSRLLEMRRGSMPVHLLLTGLSSAGKSYTIGVVKQLLPPEAYHEIDAGSPHVLIYDDAVLINKVLIFGEADSLPAGEDSPSASAIRNLLQDHHLHYQVTVRDKETGDYTVKSIDKPGPTVLVTTSTRQLGDQLSTRLFSLEVTDSKEQISAALATQAEIEQEGSKQPDSALVAYQSYLQFKAPWHVVVPFARELASAMGKMAVSPRTLRDFSRLLSLVKAVAVLRHHNRQVDIEGRIEAEIADYRAVRELVNEMYVNSSSGATTQVRAIVDAVKELAATRAEDERITNTALSKQLGIGVKQAERRAKKAVKLGWLVNREQRKYHAADYAVGEPMPEAEGLPLLESVDTVDTKDINYSASKTGGLTG